MGWRILQITKPCKLSVKNRQLVCENNEDKLTLPIEDISVIVLENRQIIFSNALLSELADNDIVLFSCDFYLLVTNKGKLYLLKYFKILIICQWSR